MKEGVKGEVDLEKFEKKLESLINECCLENGSDTPDFILAQFLKGCLLSFDLTLQSREHWYGRKLWIESRDKEEVDTGPVDEELMPDRVEAIKDSKALKPNPLVTINAVVFTAVMDGWEEQSPSSAIKTVVADLFSLENRGAVKEYLQELEEKDK